MVLVSLIPYKHFQKYINHVADPEFRVYLELWEEISLMEAGVRRLREDGITEEEKERIRTEVKGRRVTIDRM
jgi:hypothetical protein